MTLADLYLPLEDSGIALITFLMGQMFICPNLKNIKLTRVINILHTVDADTLNNWAKWSSRNPCLSLRMTIKNSSRGLKDLALPFFISGLGKISAQPHTIVKQICFPNGYVLFYSLFSLSKNWMHNVVWGCAEILPWSALNVIRLGVVAVFDRQ